MEAQSALNTLDYIVIISILASGVLALMRGFVREFMTLVALVGAFFSATHFYKFAVPFAQRFIKIEKFADGAAMGLTFVVVLTVLLIAGFFVSNMVKGQVLTTIDRSLGFLFGLGRGLLVICIVYLGAKLMFWPDIDMSPEDQARDKDRNEPPALLVNAKTRPLMAFGANILIEFVPKNMIDKELQRAEASKSKEFLSTPSKDDSSSDEDKEKSPVDVDKLFQTGK